MSIPKPSVYDPDFKNHPMMPACNSVVCISCGDESVEKGRNLAIPNLGEATASKCGSRYFVAGGRTDNGMLSCKCYISDNLAEWKEVSDLPAPRARHAAVTLENGSVLVVGGVTQCSSDGCLQLARDVLFYDAEKDFWSKISELPKRAAKLVAEVVDSKLYVIAGDTGATSEPEQPVFPAIVRDDVQILDLESNKWSTGAPKPTPETGVTSAVFGKEIFVVSSDLDIGVINSIVEVYDTVSNKWRSIPDMPTPSTNVPCGFVDGKLYCINGLGRGLVPLSIIEVYDPKTNTWETQDTSIPPSHSSGYLIDEKRLVLIGGRM